MCVVFLGQFLGVCYGDELVPELTGVEGLGRTAFFFFPTRESLRLLLDIVHLPPWRWEVPPGSGNQRLGDFGVSLSSWYVTS